MNLKLWMRWIKNVLNPNANRVRVAVRTDRQPLRVEGLSDRVNPCGIGAGFAAEFAAFDAMPAFAMRMFEPVADPGGAEFGFGRMF